MSDFIDCLARAVALMEYRRVNPSDKQPFKMTFTADGWRGTIWIFAIADSFNLEGDLKGLRVTYSLPLVSRTKFTKNVPDELVTRYFSTFWDQHSNDERNERNDRANSAQKNDALVQQNDALFSEVLSEALASEDLGRSQHRWADLRC